MDERFAIVSLLCVACLAFGLPDGAGRGCGGEARDGGRRFRCRAVCRRGTLVILEFHRSIAFYGIICRMKEVLHGRCVCRRACARPRRVVHGVHRRYAMQSVRKVTYAYDHVGRNVMKDVMIMAIHVQSMMVRLILQNQVDYIVVRINDEGR